MTVLSMKVYIVNKELVLDSRNPQTYWQNEREKQTDDEISKMFVAMRKKALNQISFFTL